MGKAARWIVGLGLLAAVAGGAWWLLQGDADVRAPQLATTTPSLAALELPEATAAPEQPVLPASAADWPVAATEPSAAAPATDAPATLTGRIVDENGRAVAGASVRHMPTSWQALKLGVRTDALAPPLDLERLFGTQTASDGRFSLPVRDHVPDHKPPQGGAGVWTGSFEDVPRLLVMHPAFETRVASCSGWRGGDFDAGDIVLVPGVALSGRAVDERGLPLAGVSVGVPVLGDSMQGPRAGEWSVVRAALHALTGDDGRFAFNGFWAGSGRLELHAPGRRTAKPTFQAKPGPLDLGDIQLERGGVIAGVLVDGEGRPVPGANVLARPADLVKAMGDNFGDAAAQFAVRMGSGGDDGSLADVDAVADESGAFRFDTLELARSPFFIYAGAPGFEVVRSEAIAVDGAPLRLELPAVASLVLTVVDAVSREPVANAKVVARRSSTAADEVPQPLKVTAEADKLVAAGVPAPHAGVFLLQPAGAVRNSATVSAPGHATQSFELPGVAAGQSKSVTVELPRPAHIAGRVFDAQRQPLADVELKLLDGKPLESPWQKRDEQGRVRSGPAGGFHFDQLAAGDWVVRAAKPGFVTTTSARLTLTEGASIDDVELVLAPSGAIAGIVLAGDKPVPRATVQASSVAQAEAVRAAERAGIFTWKDKPPREDFQTRTDAQGRFHLEDLPAVPFELSGPPGVLVVAEVKAGETTEVTLSQRARPRVRGHVTDARGPVSNAELRWSSYVEPLKAWASSGLVDGHTDTDGNFELELDGPGHYKVNAETEKAYSPVLEMNLDWDQVQWAEFTLKDRG